MTGKRYHSTGADREERERIMVAAQRPTPPAPESDAPPRAWAGDAGLALIVVIAAVAAVGALLGDAAQVPAAGALIGGLVGVVAGFAGIYTRYRNL